MARLVIFTLMFIALISGVKNCMKEEPKGPITPEVLFDEGFGVNDPIDSIVFAPFEREYPEEGFGVSDAPEFVLKIEKVVTKQQVKPQPKKRIRKRKTYRRRCMPKRTKRSVDSWKNCAFDPEKSYC
jgi:hypothetical protein